jgi:alpha-methylacyl-CoA racemase
VSALRAADAAREHRLTGALAVRVLLCAVSRGKRSIALDLKSAEGVATLVAMASQADVFVEPFRPGVVEKLGIGPDVLCAANPRLIYGRMTGYGQGGTAFETMAGHDANYLSLSGTLDLFRRGDERPMPPANFAGDYAGGGVMLAMGVLLAVIERSTSNQGQVIDAAMVDGANYVALPLHKWMQSGFVPVGEDGHVDAPNFVLGMAPHYVEAYECKEDPAKPGTKQYMSVQAIEPAFYAALLDGLGLGDAEGLPGQNDKSGWPWMKERFAGIFMTKTRDEWAEIFYGTDACCVPVLNATEAALHPHNVARGSFSPTPGGPDGAYEPNPAPKLSRTPGLLPRPNPLPGAHTSAVLSEFGFGAEEIGKLLKEGAAVEGPAAAAKL